MDTPAHQLSTTISNTTSTQSRSQNPSHNSPNCCRHYCRHVGSRLNQYAIETPRQPNASTPHTLATSRFTSPGLQPLISKFEALDADSLVFNVRIAQPPHLRLRESRMGRRSQVLDSQQMKTTRDKLLTRFDRPGWGAETLRGLQDGSSSRKFDDSLRGEGRRLAVQKTREVSYHMSCRSEENDGGKSTPYARPQLRRKSLVMDRIRFFDGGRNSLPSTQNSTDKPNSVNGTFPSQSPIRYQSTASPYKRGSYSVFPPKYRTEKLTAVKSYGYLRPKESKPLPWRPLDPRRWKMVAQQINSPVTSGGHFSKRAQYCLITPTPTNTASAIKIVQIIHQDSKRNVSEKVNLVYATTSDEDETEFKPRSRRKEISGDSDPFVDTTSSTKNPGESELGNGKFHRIAATWQNIRCESMERSKTAKESKIQDRINLFNNSRSNINSAMIPMIRMRNQSTPTKLPSQVTCMTPEEVSSTTPRARYSPTNAISITAADNIAAVGDTMTAAKEQCFKPQAQKPLVQSPALRKSSGISDKIKHFESFRTSDIAFHEKPLGNNDTKLSLPTSKRNQTWPFLKGGFTLDHKVQPNVNLNRLMGQVGKVLEHETIDHVAVSDITPTQNTNIIKTFDAHERAKQKILSRQERLNRKSRSRSRSRASISGPANLCGEASEMIAHTKQVDASIGIRRQNVAEAEQQSKIEQDVQKGTASKQPHLRDGRVQKIWIDGSEDGSAQEVVVVDAVVAQCELIEPKPMRLAETLRIMRLCRGRFRERSATWRKKGGRSSEKDGSLVA